MVGPPKSLHDLHRVEAQVKVTCTSCRASEIWELEALITEVRNNGVNTDWRTARHSLKCPSRCQSPMISLLPIPFGRQRARRRAHRQALINLALSVVREATARSASEAVGTIEVRLALHVLRPMVLDDQLVIAFWRAATSMPRHPWTSCQLPYRRIAQRLVDRGAPVEADNRP